MGRSSRKEAYDFFRSWKLAINGHSKELWLTHYSPALKDPDIYLDNARDVFQNSFAGSDGKIKTLKFLDK